MRKLTTAVVLLGLSWAAPARADVKPHGLFTEGMVLQRDARVPVWGTADPGEAVKVTLDGKGKAEAQATADKDGRWAVSLEKLQAGGPYTLIIEGKNKVVLKDVLVGEVWVCSGQSNMEWAMSALKTPEGQADIKKADNPNLRLFTVARVPANEPQRDVPAAKKGQPAKWSAATSASVGGFSATAYYFGRDLQKALNVPVGLIHSSVGGTAAERWVSRPVLGALPGVKAGKGDSDLYNGMIAPLVPFGIKGVIWYQGESNAGRASQYRQLFTTLIKNWRDDWKQGDFPFLFVQLAPYDKAGGKDGWPLLREAQLLTALTVPNTAMAVITDAGDPKDIHPRQKEPVGARLALAARGVAYGEKIVYSGPIYDAMKVDGDKAVLRFKHVGGGLVAKGGALSGFTVAGADGKFVKAEASVVEDTVVVRSPDVAMPAAVRYAWADYPVCNLYNKEGLPASPFRTDMPASVKGAGAQDR